MLNERTVDLQPLFEWCSNPEAGERPLSAWKRVRGTIVRETPYGWLVEGEAEGESQPSRFLVKNPPRERLQRFQELLRQFWAYEQERIYLNNYLDLPVRSPNDGHSDSAVPSISWRDQVAALTRLQELGRTIPSLSRELGELQDEHGNFRLDAFALRLNEQYRGLPVFDHGYSLPCGAVKMPQGKGSAAGPTKAEAMVCWVRFNGSAVFRVRTWCSGADRAL